MKPQTLAIFTFMLAFSISANAQVNYAASYVIPYPKPLRSPIDTVEMVIIGDVMMHSKQLDYDYHGFLEEISPFLSKADIAIANMEFPLGGEPYSGYPSFSTPDGYADYIAEDCGVDIFLMANNHVLDRGSDGLKRTLEKYSEMRDSHGIMFTGAAMNAAEDSLVNPLVFSRKGIKFAIVNYTYGTNSKSSVTWPNANIRDKARIESAMKKAKEDGADFIIALPHWGTEYELKHNQSQQEWAEWMVSNGADVIVGSHPHVVQDSTHINGVPVIYSVGNAISNMSAINTRVELAVVLRFAVNSASMEKSMLEPELKFMWCTLPGTLRNNYSTIFIKEWATRRTEWLNPSDYDNMVASYKRVKSATGIIDD